MGIDFRLAIVHHSARLIIIEFTWFLPWFALGHPASQKKKLESSSETEKVLAVRSVAPGPLSDDEVRVVVGRMPHIYRNHIES